MADRVDVNQGQVLESFRDSLRLACGLTERNCYLSLDPPGQLSAIPGGEVWVTLTPGEGVFVDGEQATGTDTDGNAVSNVTEELSVTVTIYTRIRLDEAGHDEILILDTDRGLYDLKRRVLHAMISRDLQLPSEVEGEGSPFLRVLTRVVHASAPTVTVHRNDATLTVGFMTLSFALTFDWDLTGGDNIPI